LFFNILILRVQYQAFLAPSVVSSVRRGSIYHIGYVALNSLWKGL